MVQAPPQTESAATATTLPRSGDAVVLRLPANLLTDDLLLAISDLNDCWRFERNTEGALEISPPAGLMSDDRSGELYFQLRHWSQGGHVVGSSAGFRLPNGTVLGPDAAWISEERVADMVEDEVSLGVGAPDLVVEVRSRGQTLRKQQEKMEEWMAAGARLGWLIDPFTDDGQAWVYREGTSEPQLLERPPTLSGEAVAEGLTIDLTKVWR